MHIGSKSTAESGKRAKYRAENEGERVYLKLFTNREKNSTINRLEIIQLHRMVI